MNALPVTYHNLDLHVFRDSETDAYNIAVTASPTNASPRGLVDLPFQHEDIVDFVHSFMAGAVGTPSERGRSAR